jgi:6-phosphogluconolactonase (cycloisomerase 2 family)
VLNQSTTNTITPTQPFSSISAFSFLPTGQLQQIAGAPYTVGSGPVCMVEDPTNQYLYVSNYNDGTLTGKFINSSTGELSDLTHGSTFAATKQATCLTLSGNVNY